MTQAETYTPTPDSTNDYTYTSDAVGNVQVVYKASGSIGQEAFFLTQDAFGNELSGDANIPASNRTNLLGGATWSSARTAGITEHQTGKWIGPILLLLHGGLNLYVRQLATLFCGAWRSPEWIGTINNRLEIHGDL
ncbi:MAG: hypothetical protein AMXMBFR75_30960 [Candidatus Hinthialibacteria bacterium]